MRTLKYRVAFFWDKGGQSVTLWLRSCILPPHYRPAEILADGFWVMHDGEVRYNDGWPDMVWLPAPEPGAVLIPPGRISSITAFAE